MSNIFKGALIVFLCILVLGYIERCDSGATEYYVPDPVAMKEGEMQWLRLPRDKVKVRWNKKVIYTVDGETYSTRYFVTKF